MKLKTNYSAHERAYQARVQAGRTSWDSSEQYASFFASISEFVPLKYFERGTKWLELGCGAGDVSEWLVHQGVNVTGVDISATAVLLAQEKFKLNCYAGHFFVHDVTTDGEGLKAFGKFNVVLDSHLLHCILGEHRKHLLENIKEYLAEDGIVVIATMCGTFTDALGYSFKYPVLSANGIAQRHIATAEDIIEEVQAAGFRVEKKTVKTRECAEEQDELFLILSRTV